MFVKTVVELSNFLCFTILVSWWLRLLAVEYKSLISLLFSWKNIGYKGHHKSLSSREHTCVCVCERQSGWVCARERERERERERDRVNSNVSARVCQDSQPPAWFLCEVFLDQFVIIPGSGRQQVLVCKELLLLTFNFDFLCSVTSLTLKYQQDYFEISASSASSAAVLIVSIL